MLTPANVDWFLVVPNRSHVKGHKLKVMKKVSSKKRSTSKTPKKCIHQMEGEVLTSHPTKDTEGALLMQAKYGC